MTFKQLGEEAFISRGGKQLGADDTTLKPKLMILDLKRHLLATWCNYAGFWKVWFGWWCGDAVKIHGEKEIDMKLCRLWRAIRKIAWRLPFGSENPFDDLRHGSTHKGHRWDVNPMLLVVCGVIRSEHFKLKTNPARWTCIESALVDLMISMVKYLRVISQKVHFLLQATTSQKTERWKGETSSGSYG